MKDQSDHIIFLYLIIAFFSLLPAPVFSSELPSQNTDPSTRRETRSGSVMGFIDSEGAQVWLGIPYAAPPVGDLRWRAPRPPTPWNGVLHAVNAGPKCSQYGHEKTPILEGSEDCLYLNIWSPPGKRQRLPVMMWIHGGAGVFGEGSRYNGAMLTTSQNVVVVTINYRLGYFGRFTHPALRASMDNDEDRSGNYSTLDQIQALRWIKENIEAFGGDPGNVTIFGESAGGTAVISLLLAPSAKGWFHKAIAQSGKVSFIDVSEMDGSLTNPDQGLVYNAQAILINLLINDKKAKDYKAAKTLVRGMRDEDIFHYLHKKSPADLLAAHSGIELRRKELNLPGTMFYLPEIIDGAVIPKGEIESEEDFNHVPVILGSNRDEHILFLLADSSFAKQENTNFSSVLKAKPYDIDQINLANEYLGMLWRAFSVDEIASRIVKYRPHSVFSYRLDWDIALPQLAAPGRAPYYTPHGVDMAFLFGNSICFPCPLSETEKISEETKKEFNFLSSAIMSYWAEFAATGEPGQGTTKKLPHWDSWSNSNGNPERFILLDSPAKGGLQMLTGSISKKQILDQLANDSRFASIAERCGFLKKLLSHQFLIGLLVPEDYPSFAGGACIHHQSESISKQ